MSTAVNILWVVCSVACVCLLFGNVSCDELEHTCNMYGNVTVVNPDASTLIFAVANSSNGLCDTTFSSSKEELYIYCGAMNQNISVILSPDANGIPAIITSAVKYYLIQCQEIPEAGITRSVVDESWVTNMISTARLQSVSPALPIVSVLKDNGTDEVKSVVMIGEPMIWEITGPETYTVIPLNCTAFSGSIDSSHAESLVIVENGCSLDHSILGDFSYLSNVSKHIVYSNLYAFRFQENENVTIICELRGCPPLSDACDINLLSPKSGLLTTDGKSRVLEQTYIPDCGTERKRREVDSYDFLETETVTKRSVGQRYGDQQTNERFHKNVGLSFTVLYEPGFYFSGSRRATSFGAIVVVSLLIHLVARKLY